MFTKPHPLNSPLLEKERGNRDRGASPLLDVPEVYLSLREEILEKGRSPLSSFYPLPFPREGGQGDRLHNNTPQSLRSSS